MTVDPSRFDEFYAALHPGQDPFPWQSMLARRVIEEGWPECLDLPTASGKTAVLDIAVYALAVQADRLPSERTAPRRIFFTVDRRIIVDAAYERACKVVKALARAETGILRSVADRLRLLHGGRQPIRAARIRGGIARDDGWVRSPAQPVIVTGTVDQVGSRLLFRAYGPSALTASVHAALAGNDSLIVVDEAHCSVPFVQTLQAVRRYRASPWAAEALALPLQAVVMSATPSTGLVDVFPPAQRRGASLDHPELKRRRGSKVADLVVVSTERDAGDNSDIAPEIVERATRLANSGARRIGVIVNRVATARAIAGALNRLRQVPNPEFPANVVLMTGRMRPLDRDDLIGRWADVLGPRRADNPTGRPVVVVSTQCLEVGADFSFDALLTECASLDALRQRFGRLNRFGASGGVHSAAILIRSGDIKSDDQIEKLANDGKPGDPIYGHALARTWNWMRNRTSTEHAAGSLSIDFGIDAMDGALPNDPAARSALLTQLSAQAPDAPVMLPSHVDCWVQTAPHPRPDPDIGLFLHGPSRGEPDVHVVIRADLDPTVPDRWVEAVSMCPPTSGEAFPVPLHVARHWIAGDAEADHTGDVEGVTLGDISGSGPGRRRVVLWRGRSTGSGTHVTDDPREVRASDVVVVPMGDWQAPGPLGDVPELTSGQRVLDLGDRAFLAARNRPLLRLQKGVLSLWQTHPTIGALLKWAPADQIESGRTELNRLLTELGSPDETVPEPSDGIAIVPPRWMKKAAEALARESRIDVMEHPCGGYVLRSRTRLRTDPALEGDTFEDEDDLTSASERAVSLRDHLGAVRDVAVQFAEYCLPPEIARSVVRAAQLHDLGKADWRFQVMLNGGNEVEAFRRGELLAKSDSMPESIAASRRARGLAHLPDRFRHELLSAELVQRTPALAADADIELVLHLIASHHGYCRPFAPLCLDHAPPDVDLAEVGFPCGLTSLERLESMPAHHIASGIPERFWRLTRRYGCWGLAYIEAVLRLADWSASAPDFAVAHEVRLDTEVA